MGRTEVAIVDTASRGDGRHEITIAANSNVEGPYPPIDLTDIDVDGYMRNPVVLWEHGHKGNGIPIGRTLAFNRLPDNRIKATFEFDLEDPFAKLVGGSYDRGFIRAASINCSFKSYEDFKRGQEPRLKEWSLVAVPLDPGATRSILSDIFSVMLSTEEPSAQRSDPETPEVPVEPTDTPTQVADPPNPQPSNDPPANPPPVDPTATRSISQADVQQIVTALTPALAPVITNAVSTELDRRAEVAAAERSAAEKKEEGEQDMLRRANRRAELLTSVRSVNLIPADMDTSAMADRDILVAAVGETVTNVAERSDDYLWARVDTLVEERRSASANKPPSGRAGAGRENPSDDKDPRTEALRSYAEAQDERYAKAGGR